MEYKVLGEPVLREAMKNFHETSKILRVISTHMMSYPTINIVNYFRIELYFEIYSFYFHSIFQKLHTIKTHF